MLNQDDTIRQQDNQLDIISTSVSRLKCISENIHNELLSQRALFSELESGIDTTQENMKTQVSIMKKNFKKVKTCKLFLIILVLFMILGVLLYIILIS